MRAADEVVGHAVRQLYLNAGATDLYLETGEAALGASQQRLWHNAVARKMHVIGGYGARQAGEAFGADYELPNDTCYLETCAAIAAMMWNWRLLLASGDPRYAEELERSMYNGFLSGVSLDGAHFFYVNPLSSPGGIARPEWYGCACCPPNVMRQIAMIGHYMVTQDGDGVQLHQYLPARLETEHGVLAVACDYPRDGPYRRAARGVRWRRVDVAIARALFLFGRNGDGQRRGAVAGGGRQNDVLDRVPGSVEIGSCSIYR